MRSTYQLVSIRVIIIIAFSFLFSKAHASMSDPVFVTQWETSNAGTGSSCKSCITIPVHPNLSYNYNVDWESDGIFDDFNASEVTTT